MTFLDCSTMLNGLFKQHDDDLFYYIYCKNYPYCGQNWDSNSESFDHESPGIPASYTMNGGHKQISKLK